MTIKERAEELVSKFVFINLSQVNDLVDGIRIRLAKESALIAVNELIREDNAHEIYWTEVEQEIKNL